MTRSTVITCQCPSWDIPCQWSVTQEDLLCDGCRGGGCNFMRLTGSNGYHFPPIRTRPAVKP